GGDAKKKPAANAQRSSHKDGRQRDHRALPLAEHGKEAETERAQPGQPAPAGVKAHERHDGDDRDPGKRRENLDGAGSLPGEKAGGEQAEYHRVGYVDEGSY